MQTRLLALLMPLMLHASPLRQREMYSWLGITTTCSKCLSVFRLDKVGERLGLALVVVVVTVCGDSQQLHLLSSKHLLARTVVVVVVMGILGGANIIHLEDIAALWASLNRSVSSHLNRTLSMLAGKGAFFDEVTYGEPDNVMRVGRDTGATSILLLASRLDNDGVVKGTCTA